MTASTKLLVERCFDPDIPSLWHLGFENGKEKEPLFLTVRFQEKSEHALKAVEFFHFFSLFFSLSDFFFVTNFLELASSGFKCAATGRLSDRSPLATTAPPEGRTP
jgi:hypothetical protein